METHALRYITVTVNRDKLAKSLLQGLVSLRFMLLTALEILLEPVEQFVLSDHLLNDVNVVVFPCASDP